MLVTRAMRPRRLATFAIVLLAAWSTRPEAAEDEPSVQVQVSTVKRQTLRETATAYGHVQPDPDHVSGVTLPRAGFIGRLWVRSGQRVAPGQKLFELTTAPKTQLDYQQAETAVRFARAKVERLQSLLQEQMTTREQLASAQHELKDAEAQLQAQKKLGTGVTSEIINAPFDAIVMQVSVSQGQRVQADTTALLLAHRDALVVPLGVEPEVAVNIAPGQAATLVNIFHPDVVVSSTVSSVHALVNPNTRLVDVLVPIPKGRANRFIPNEYVQGGLILRQEQALAVPRSAVLRDTKGSYVFVIHDGHAQRVDVKRGLTQAGVVAVSGNLRQGDTVVTLGNYELQDGMAVRVEQP